MFTNLSILLCFGSAASGVAVDNGRFGAWNQAVQVSFCTDVQKIYDHTEGPLTNYDREAWEFTDDSCDYLVLESFAERFLNGIVEIDPSIRQVIADNYWDMI